MKRSNEDNVAWLNTKLSANKVALKSFKHTPETKMRLETENKRYELELLDLRKSLKSDDILQNLNLSWDDVQQKSNKIQIVWTRMILAKNMRESGLKFTEISQILRKDHSTIIHYLHQFDDYMFYQDFKNYYNKAFNLLTTKENDTHHKPSAEATECIAEKTKFKRSKSRNGGTSYQRHKNEFGGAY